MWSDYQIMLLNVELDQLADGKTFTALAMDGPLNGRYITVAQATQNNYYPDVWDTGEFVWSHDDGVLDEAELSAAAARADLWEAGLVA